MKRLWRETMNRRFGFAIAGTLVFLFLIIPGIGIADDIGACVEHFPLLQRSLTSKGQGLNIDSEDLLRELKIERALWLDEVEHQRKVLNAAGAPQDRLLAADSVMRRRFGEIAALIHDGSPLSVEAQEALQSCGEARRSFPSGPLSTASVLPEFRHRTPALPDPLFPEAYRDTPSESMREAVKKTRSHEKSGFEPEGPDLIAAKASELGDDPMALYAFVLNEIRPTLSVGAMRDEVSVLRTGEGNDAEQAGLLAALFRETGYPARLAWGIQEIGVEKLLDHFGAGDFRALERTLTAAGIAWEPVLVGGSPAAYRLERVWCEVWLPFGNFRGVVLDATGATWVTLDPYLKNFEEQETPAVLDNMNFDEGPWIDAYLAGADCTAPLSEAGACPAPRDLLIDEVAAFLEGSVTTVEEAVTPPPIRSHSEPILPTAMGGKIVAVSGVDVELPEALRHRIRMVAKDGVLTLFDGEFSASDLVGKEAVIWFVPATFDDEAILAAYGGELWRVPPYLINLTPELRIDGEAVQRGVEGIGMGRAFEWEFVLSAPGGNSTGFVNTALAGVPTGFGLAPGFSGYEPVFGEPSNTLEVLASLAGSWLDGVGTFEKEMAALAGGAVIHPFPNMVSVASVMRVESSLGLIEGLEWLGVSVDADVHASRLVGEAEAQRQWLEMVELDASARERLLFETGYATPSISADKALMLGATTGVTIHHIDTANLGAILPTLPFDADVLDEIEGWVLAGGEAWVPAEEIQTLEWTGVGYRLWDPDTGENRYQLAGRLSGGMTAAPPFEVVEGLRDPLQYPSPEYVNSDPTAAVYIEIFDGNLQIGTAGDELSLQNNAIPLRARVFDVSGRPVKDAPVEFQVLGGGGGFGGPGIGTISATSNAVGIAETVLTLGEHTSDNPYYLLFPDDEHSTRCGLTVVTASVNGFGMPDVFWEMAEPGDLDQLLTPRGTSVEALPHLSAGSLVAVPADQYENPISNVEVTYVLNGSTSSEPDEGPELLSRDEKEQCRPGLVMAGECPGGSGSKTDTGGVTGTWVYLIIGDEDITVTATGTDDSGSADVTFSGHSRTQSVPGDWAVGWPVILVSKRGQPVNQDGEILEAYPPGEQSLALQVSLFIVREDFSVHECDNDNRYCTVPLGTYRTKRLGQDEASGCQPESCGGGTLNERGQVHFSGAGADATISTQDADGNYTHQVTMPTSPGRYEITASPTVWIAVPKIPDDPDYVNEVVPCPSGDDPCGARMELDEVSDANWETNFVLWSVQAQVTEPPPIVKLGHKNRHEEVTEFPFTIEPSNYPAMNTVVYFLEDGQIRLTALAEGQQAADPKALVPPGEIFAHPEGDHKVGIYLNYGWVWQPYPGEPVSMVMEGEQVDFRVVMSDLDVDSNNNDGIGELERDDLEDSLEAGGGDSRAAEVDAQVPRGKIVFVNHNDDDNDGVPDFADLEMNGGHQERSMVPIVIEVRPEGGDYEDVWITFHYDGQTEGQIDALEAAYNVNFPDPEMKIGGLKKLQDPETWGYPDGDGEGYQYKNFSQYKTGQFRIWNVEDPSDPRGSYELVESGDEYPVTWLGFDSDHQEKTFWVEAINGIRVGDPWEPAEIRVEVSLESGDVAQAVEDTIVLYPVEGNLGVNNGNNKNNDTILRPGVPDETFTIDEYDEMVEDQGDGFRFWRSERSYFSVENIEDLAPLILEVHQELLDAGFELALSLDIDGGGDDSESLRLGRMPEGTTRLSHLRLIGTANKLVYGDNEELPWSEVVKTGDPPNRLPELSKAKSELVFSVKPGDGGIVRATIRMFAARKEHWYQSFTDDRDWQAVDSVRLTIAPIESFFSAYTVRKFDSENKEEFTEPDNVFEYPTEVVDDDPKTIFGMRFPLARHVDDSFGNGIPKTGTPNPDIKPSLVWLHGYNVSFDAAIDWARVAYKRLYWVGYRGNLILFTWRGNPQGATGFAHFGLANQWGLQTSESLRIFLRDEMNVPPEKIHVLGHSLGNLVVYDAMRLDRAKGNSGKLFHNFISTEAAIWGETLWPQAPVEYCPDGGGLFCNPITYSIRELQCSSWTFWFNQQGREAWKAVDRIYHSYSPDDNVLTLIMRESDRFLRQAPAQNPHYYRPECSDDDDFRVPWTPRHANGDIDMSLHLNPQLCFGDSFHPGCPALLDPDDRRFLPYTHLALELPAGAASNPMVGTSHGNLTLNDVNARDLGWNDSFSPTGGHSNLKGETFPDIFHWWEALVSDNGALPKGREF